MVATPDALVSAVPLDGVIVAKVASVVKVTTALGTATPLLSDNVAVTVVGVAEAMEVTGAPAELVSEIVNALKEVVVVVVVEEPPEVEEVAVPDAPPQPLKRIVTLVANMPKITAEILCLIERTIVFFPFYAQRAIFITSTLQQKFPQHNSLARLVNKQPALNVATAAFCA
jgi:hypothetical protein